MAQTDDVVIIGAGASGINAAYQVKTHMPDARFTILESREAIGGTWSFFKYPGFRSDSYLTGFGFRWRPWFEEKEIASGPSIQKYLEDSVAEADLDRHILFKHRATEAHWSSKESKWTLVVDVDGGRSTKTIKANFIVACSGYYDYKTPLKAEIPGITNFKGTVVHPQFWPEDLDYANKRIIIIGSGATTITIFPELAKTARHVTMLQRSPSYVVPLPSAPSHIYTLRRWFPKRVADLLNFWKDVLFQTFSKAICFAFPSLARKVLIKRMEKLLEGSGIPVNPHFTPSYNPWEQRICVCPDGDFYDALKQKNIDVVTDHIETVTESSILTKTGKTIEADIIITATGLNLMFLGGMNVTVDGEKINIGERYAWRNFMLEGVPNMAMVVGYTDMSWTLGSDACLRLMLRVIQEMKKRGAVAVKPVVSNQDKSQAEPVISMKSTYFLVARDRLPKKGSVDPWDARKGYIPESWLAKFGSSATLLKGLELIVPTGDHKQTQDAQPKSPQRVNGVVNGRANKGKTNGIRDHQKRD